MDDQKVRHHLIRSSIEGLWIEHLYGDGWRMVEIVLGLQIIGRAIAILFLGGMTAGCYKTLPFVDHAQMGSDCVRDRCRTDLRHDHQRALEAVAPSALGVRRRRIPLPRPALLFLLADRPFRDCDRLSALDCPRRHGDHSLHDRHRAEEE